MGEKDLADFESRHPLTISQEKNIFFPDCPNNDIPASFLATFNK